MKPMSFEENRKIQVEILLEFAAFCEKNNLQYFLAYGTLLGAVRHKGFIPWDDDIDVSMPRPDYDKFIKLYKEQMTDSRYQISAPGDAISKHSFVKIYDSKTVKIEDGIEYKGNYPGIDIDVWPIDGQPEDDETFAKWYKKLKFKYLLLFGAVSTLSYGSFKRRCKVLAVKIAAGKKEKVLAQTEKLHKKYPYDKSVKVGTTISYFNPKTDRCLKEWYRESVLLDFEGYQLKAPVDYHKILTQVYGDYMKLPPIEQQVTHHSNNVFWKE